jgi:iron complex transport system substrate-binding protein
MQDAIESLTVHGARVRAGQLRLAALVALVACNGHATPHAHRAGSDVRVVSLHDVTTEIVVALGAEKQLVGVAEPVDTTKEVKAAIGKVPRAGGLETILALRPDVVLGLAVVAQQDPELVARLRQAGVDVFLGSPARLEDVYGMTRAIAQRVGAVSNADKLVSALRAKAGVPRPGVARRPQVFVYDCCDPPFTAGANTVLSDLIERAGGHNVFADVAADWTHVSWEEVVARRPDLIVVHAYRHDGQGDVTQKQNALRAITSLANVPVVVLPLGCSLGGLRSIEGLEKLRAAIEGLS